MKIKRVIGGALLLGGFCVPLYLGVWQVQRGAWKQNILTQLEQEYRKDAGSYAFQKDDFYPNEDGDFKVVRGSAEGFFINETTLYWPNLKDGNYVLEMLSPFRMKGSDLIIMVNRGRVAEDLERSAPQEIIPYSVNTPMVIEGLARAHQHNFFTFNNQPKDNRWYRFDVTQIASEMGVSADQIAPFVLYAENAEAAQGGARALNILGDVVSDRIYPKDNHRQYAAFWFTMAGLWAVIMGLKFFRKQQ